MTQNRLHPLHSPVRGVQILRRDALTLHLVFHLPHAHFLAHVLLVLLEPALSGLLQVQVWDCEKGVQVQEQRQELQHLCPNYLEHVQALGWTVDHRNGEMHLKMKL